MKKAGVYLSIAFLSATTANAATFTAVASGNFTSSATWGGMAPSGSILGDIIIIPSGINVTMDEDVALNGALSVLTVNGTLTSNTGSDLMLTLGTLSGNGTITVDSLSMALTSGLSFTGSIVADQFTSMGASISSSANVTVTKTLRLMGGILTLASGNLTLSSGGTIVVSGGTISTTGGVVDLTNNYHVRYTGSSATTGLELSGAGLANIDIDVPSGSSVKLSSNLNVKGTLTLNSGALDLNGNDLTFSGNSNIAASGNGTISATSGSGSDITINASNSLSGMLRFSSNANTVNNFTINMNNNSHVVNLGSSLNIGGSLNLQSGKIVTGNNMITVNAGGSVTGGSSNSYIVTSGEGKLMLSVNAGGSGMFHVGTVSKYAPAMIAANSGSANGMVSVRVHESVYTQGNSGGTLSATQPVVDATWHVTSTATSNINLNMKVMWSADMEVNNFNRNEAYISHYSNTQWDVMANASATAESNGMYSLTRNNVNSLSPFAVMGKNANVSVNAIAENNVNIYPNPVTNTLSFNANAEINKVIIYDIAGRMVQTTDVSGNTNTVSVEGLNSGLYYAHFYSGTNKSVQKFVKN